VRQQIHDRLFSMSNLDELAHLTFETFQSRGHIGLPPQQADSLEMGLNHAQQFARTQEGWLLLQGGYGCGKTHLAAAIANFSVSMGVPTLFITVPDMLDSLRFSYSDEESGFEERFEEIRNAPLLVLDDFGTQNATPWAQEKLFQILNYRYINHLPLVITTNLSLSDIEGRIRSRLLDPMVSRVFITAPDYRNPGDDTGGGDLSCLSQLRDCTFARFDLRRSEGIPAADAEKLENAFKAARAFAENPQGWLVFLGGYGSGKTHLAAAIANYRADLGYDVSMVLVPDLLDYLRAAFNPNSPVSMDRRFNEVRNKDLLVLDDLGTQSMTPWAREKLFQLFTHRYNDNRPTVITTSDRLDDIEPRLRSRLLDRRLCKRYALDVPPYSAPEKTRPAARRKK
jgi:DNA replication protein DnaC